MRIASVRPPEDEGTTDGLAWSLFLPADAPRGGVVVLHGADSTKESHHGFARACRESGLAALVADQRGHGASDGPMDGRMVDDVVGLADLLRDRLDGGGAVGGAHGVHIALRGSSMGGYLALAAARRARARAVVAICPATQDGLRRGLSSGRFSFRADVDAVTAVIDAEDPVEHARDLDGDVALLLLHAEGDEQVPVEHSREIHAAAPGSRLVAVPGGHHRSVQHDAELEGVSIRFLRRALAAREDAVP